MSLYTHHDEVQEEAYLDVELAVDARRHRIQRRRRRFVAIGILALVGLVLSAVWAAGLVTTSPGPSTAAEATLVLGAAPSTDPNTLAARITAGPDTALPINFTGKWGAIPADVGGASDPASSYELFELDLSGLTGNHFVEIGVNNAPNDFRVLHVKFVIDDDAPCATADLATPDTSQVLVADTNDAVAVFSGLTSATADVCVGVQSITPRANDATGTFIRRNDGTTTAPDPMPAFFAVLGRHS